MTNPTHVFPEGVRLGVLADIRAGVSVQTAAANWLVSTDTVYSWMQGRTPKPEPAPLPKRQCSGHSETHPSGRCQVWFVPESQFIRRCEACHSRERGQAA